MPTPSSSSVARKLGIKPGDRIAILYSPRGYTSILGELPPEVTLTTRLAGEPFALVQGFYEDARSLKADLPKLRKAIRPDGKIWICWRKQNATELGRDAIAHFAQRAALTAVGICSVDDEWSGLKLMLPKDKRKTAGKAAKK